MKHTIWDMPHVPLPPWHGSTGVSQVVVVGLGGSGLAAIHRLLDAGRTVVGLDAQQVGQSAAGRNGGFLLAGPAHFYHRAVAEWGRDLARAFYQATLDAQLAMVAETPREGSVMGSLRLPASDAEVEDIAAHLDALRADGFAVQPWGRGLRIPDDAVFHPQARLASRLESAWKRGAWLYGDTRVLAVSEGEVLTDRGALRCDGVIVAVDGGLERLVPQLGGRVRTVRLQMLSTAPAEVQVPGAVYRRFGLDYWHQRPDGRIALGGARDRGGEAEAEPPFDATSPVVQKALEQLLREEVGTRAPIEHRWAAPVSYTQNHVPIFEEVAPRVWVTGAYSGTGNVLGWLGGRAAAEQLITGTSEWGGLLKACCDVVSGNISLGQ